MSVVHGAVETVPQLRACLRLGAVLAVAMASVAVAPLPAMAQAQTAQGLPSVSPDTVAPGSFSRLVQPLLPAVVNISTTVTVGQDRGEESDTEQERGPRGVPRMPPGLEEFFRDFFGGPGGPGGPPGPPGLPGPRQGRAVGSGFIIDQAGYIVTNNHVVENAERIEVTLHDETVLEAELVGRDPRTDLALVKVDGGQPLPALQWGNSDQVQVGEWVVAIGNPFGLGGTVTAGIISARARNINVGPYDEFLQTDASINRGNSGGPMFNMQGQVIGINTAIFSPTGGNIGIGFAIPSSLAQPIIDQLRETGEIRRGWLGVGIQQVNAELAESLGLDQPRGALVAEVTEGGPAAEAGMRVGDVVLSFDGQPVEDAQRLPRLVADAEIGSSADLVIWRNRSEQRLTVQVGNLDDAPGATPPAAREPEEAPGRPSLGLGLAPLTPEARRQFEIPEDVEGVLVGQVAPGSPAAERGVRPGDVLVQVGQMQVTAPREVVKAVEEARERGDKRILLLLSRGGSNRFIPVPLG